MLDRSAHAIMVPSAHSVAGLGIIRSLGAAGYPVHAVAMQGDALGFRSRFAGQVAIHPPSGSSEFAPWFHDYVKNHSIDMVTPGAFDYSTPAVFNAYSHLFTTPSEPEIVRETRSKVALFEKLAAGDATHRSHLPPYLLVDFDRPLPAVGELAALGLPLFIKLDDTEARQAAPSCVMKLASADEARLALERLSADYRRGLATGFVPGRGAGAFLLRWDDRIIARMMHLRMHEMPHTGGASSLRRSWWHEAMMRDAETKIAHLDWQGVVMVEYRWDAARDAFHLMEMNLRFWGSLHLALFAGVDFPRLLADAFFGEFPNYPVQARLGIICRNTIPAEVGYLVSLWRDPLVSRRRKLLSLLEAAWLSVDPRIYNDLLYPGDRKVYLSRLSEFLRGRL